MALHGAGKAFSDGETAGVHVLSNNKMPGAETASGLEHVLRRNPELPDVTLQRHTALFTGGPLWLGDVPSRNTA